MAFGQAGAAAPCPKLVAYAHVGPGVECVIGRCVQYDLELAGTKKPGQIVSSGSEYGRILEADPGNSTSQRMHVRTAIGCEAVVCGRTRKAVGALLPFPQAFSGA